MSDELKSQFGTGSKKGNQKFSQIVDEIKKAGKGKKYDCVIGVSGGIDSSYMIHMAVNLGLRPLAVHYDNTWNSAIATENIRKILNKLNVDLFTHVTNNKESDDIFNAFFKSGVAELDASTDLAFAQTHYLAAAKYGVKYVLEGHSFIEEGVSPLSTMYFDGRYIKSIHQRYGQKKMRTYPLMTFGQFMKWTLFKRIRKIRPYWYIEYSKEEAKKILEKEYGWEYYGGHHLENRMSAFMHSYYLPNRYQIDQRNNSLSARVRNGSMDRHAALIEYSHPPHLEDGLVGYFQKRLGLTEESFNEYMSQPLRSFENFPTYKRRFERFRPLFFLLAKVNLVPMSFYLKYCFPIRSEKL